jgi:hypothetical protein
MYLSVRTPSYRNEAQSFAALSIAAVLETILGLSEAESRAVTSGLATGLIRIDMGSDKLLSAVDVIIMQIWSVSAGDWLEIRLHPRRAAPDGPLKRQG